MNISSLQAVDLKDTLSCHISRHFQQKADKNAFLSLHYLFHVSMDCLAVYPAEIYELEVS